MPTRRGARRSSTPDDGPPDASGNLRADEAERRSSTPDEGPPDASDSLRADDRFQLLAFAMDVEPLTDGIVKAKPGTLDSARRALARLQAGGGTEMTRAMVEALHTLRPDLELDIRIERS